MQIDYQTESHTKSTRTDGHVRDQRSVGRLLRELTEDSTTLVQQEIDLVRAEMSEKASKLGRNAAMIAVGGMVLYAGLLSLIAAAVYGLAHAMVEGDLVTSRTALWLSALIVGVVVVIIGAIMLSSARKKIRNEGAVPRRTMRSLRETGDWMRNEVTR